MKKLLCIFLMVFSISVYAQNVQRTSLGMSGNTTTITNDEKSYYISESIGQQSVIGTFSNNQKVIRQGFQQPPIKIVTSTLDESGFEAAIYPNPVKSNVFVSFKEKIKNTIYTTLYDINGRVIINTTNIPTQTYNVDMSHLAAGSYLLKITIKNKTFTTQLIKN